MSGTSAPAVFDYTRWSLRYPELAGSVNAQLAQMYFDEATLYVSNTSGSIVSDTAQRLTILNMLVAHIAKLNAPIAGVAPSGLVGRVNAASEGSVSVGVADVPGTPAWYSLTPYGFAAWQFLASYRTFRYAAGPGTRRYMGGGIFRT